jgi:hypothetical protein
MAQSMFQSRQLQLLQHSLCSWYEQYRKAQEVRTKMQKHFQRRQVCLLGRIVREWAAICLIGSSLGGLDRRRERRVQLRVMKLWFQLVMGGAQMRVDAEQWAVERKWRFLRKIMAAWKGQVDVHQLELERLRACIKRKKVDK